MPVLAGMGPEPRTYTSTAATSAQIDIVSIRRLEQLLADDHYRSAGSAAMMIWKIWMMETLVVSRDKYRRATGAVKKTDGTPCSQDDNDAEQNGRRE